MAPGFAAGARGGSTRSCVPERPLRAADVRGEGLPHLGEAGRAEAYRVRQARRDGDAVMCEARREIEHVAGTEHLVGIGREALEDAEVEPLAKARVLRRPRVELPAALAHALDQEHVVAVEVRADAPARRRIAHHHVVDAHVRDETRSARGAARPRAHGG